MSVVIAQRSDSVASPNVDACRPATAFISYASEDSDIAQAVYQSLQALGEIVYHQIKIFFDSKSMSGGHTIRHDIRGFCKNEILP
jgi:hypothetical protein